MTVAIIDADLIGRKNHRFPNLVCMKLSGYHKDNDHNVVFKRDYNSLKDFDKVYIAKVFTDTPIDEGILKLSNVEYGGTGFFYDKAVPLSYEVEHHKPDYSIYPEHKDYSIGFLTRGCFRQCPFCVNKHYKNVQAHSPLEEFLDDNRKKICLLDDNFLGYPKWEELLLQLQATGKRFVFKQGLDGRLLTPRKCELLFASKYEGDFIFAFDNWADREVIESKLKLIREYTDKMAKFYVLCGFDRANKYDSAFWERDLQELLDRIDLLFKYGCLPYVMRYNKYIESPYSGLYILISRWINQVSFAVKTTLAEFVEINNRKLDYERLASFPKDKYYAYRMRFGGH